MFISDFLSKGKENAVTAKELCNILDIKERDLTQAIERERRQGQPICASCGKVPGYFLAANKAEMQEYCDSLYRRAGEIHKTRKACIVTLKELPAEDNDPTK